jgi:putative membrane protein
MMWWGDGWGGAAWGWFALMHLLWWALVIIGIIALVRWGTSGGARHGRQVHENRALEILRERYARGEIDKEEFEERKRILSS